MKVLKCDMTKDCTAIVTHIDGNGFVYCTRHGLLRKQYQKCRKLTAKEAKVLQSGQQLKSY